MNNYGHHPHIRSLSGNTFHYSPKIIKSWGNNGWENVEIEIKEIDFKGSPENLLREWGLVVYNNGNILRSEENLNPAELDFFPHCE